MATYSADDPENSTTSTWTLDGDDKSDFEISDGGVLSFLAVPDHEVQDEYSLTVQNSDGQLNGILAVTITITNVDEHGEIELTSEQPQVDTQLTATLEDPDDDLSDIVLEVGKLFSHYHHLDDRQHHHCWRRNVQFLYAS